MIAVNERRIQDEATGESAKETARGKERRRGRAKAVVYDFGSEPRTFQRSLSDLTRYAGSELKISSDTPST